MFVISKDDVNSYDDYDGGKYLVFEYIENNKKKYLSFLEDIMHPTFMLGFMLLLINIQDV